MNKKYLIFKKITSIGLVKLCYILIYKFLYQINIVNEKNKLNKISKKNILFKLPYKYKELDFYSCKKYYDLCCLDQSVLSVADSILKNQIILFDSIYTIKETDWLKDPISGKVWDANVFFKEAKIEAKGYGEVKYIMELNKMGFLVNLAQAYYVTSDEKYIQKMLQYVKGWIQTVPYYRSVVNKSMLDISFRCINLIHITLLCNKSDLFKQEVFSLILSILFFSEKQISKFSTPRWCKYSTGANHTIGEMAGLLVTQLFLSFFIDAKYTQCYKRQFFYLNRSLKNIITDKGVYLEQSAHYTKLVTEFLVVLDIFIKTIKNTEANRYYTDIYLKQLLQYISILSYNNKLPNFGDNDGAKVLLPFYENSYSISHLLKYHEELNDEDKSISLICKASGQFIWKSKDNLKLYVFIRSGKHSFLPVGSGSHAHNDLLSLILSVNNEELFIDHGTYFYNSGIDIINRDRLTANHNTVSIGKIEQASFGGKWMYASYPKSDFIDNKICMDKSTFVFSGMCQYQEISHTRTIEYKDHQMIITDDIVNQTDENVCINYLLSPQINVTKESDLSYGLYNENRKLTTVLFEETMDIKISESFYYPSYGVEKKTKRMMGISKIKGSQTIKTVLEFC